VLVMIVGFGIQFSSMLFFSTFAFFGEDVLFRGFDPQQTSLGIGILIGFVGLGQIMTQFLVLKRLLRRLIEGKIVIIGTLAYGCALLILMTVGSPWLAAPVMALLAIGSGIANPSLQSLATGTVDDELRGGVLGVLQSSSSLAMIAGTALAGSLFAVSARFPMIIGGVVSLLLVLPALYLQRNQMRRKLTADVPVV
jgi:predicted MFS family arabinose efflux permease